MPQTKKAQKKEILDHLKEFNKTTGVELTFEELYDKISYMLTIEDKEEREDAFVAFYLAFTQITSEKLLAKKSVLNSSLIIGDKNRNNPAMSYSITQSSGKIHDLARLIIYYIDPEIAKNYFLNPRQLGAIREYQTEVIKSHNYYDEIPKCLKEWNYKCYSYDIKTLKTVLEGHVYGANIKNTSDIAMAELYYKRNLIKEELERHGGVWKFFNFIKVIACNKFIEKADTILRSHGFNYEQHGAGALEILKKTIMPPHDIDLEHIESDYDKGKHLYDELTMEELSVAKEKVERARELDANPETSLKKMLEPFVKKYKLEATLKGIGLDEESIKKAADSYDKVRELDGIKRLAKAPFFFVLGEMIKNAMTEGKEMNFAEMISDARKINVMATQRYTSFFELEEFANIKTPVYMYCVTEEWIINRINYYSKSVLSNLEDAKKSAMENGEPIPEQVQKACDALTPEKIEVIKAQAAEAVRELLANINNLMNEDRELAKSFSMNLANGNDGVVNEEKIASINDSSLSSDEILNLKEEMNKSFNGNVASNVEPISDENIKKLDAKNISN